MEKPKKKPQRQLEAAELDQSTGFTKKWTRDQLALIWQRKMPVDANLGDFQLFLYACETRDLDPLLGEVYCRLQWDKDSQEFKLLILDGIHGMLKAADKTGQLNGIKTTFQEIDGQLRSATTLVWKKGCDQAFEYTAYWDEFVGMHEGQPTFMWRTKPHVMLGKCSQANALRLAFAAALAGVYVPEELEHSDAREPGDTNFAVGETIKDADEFTDAVDKAILRLDTDVNNTTKEPPHVSPSMPDQVKQAKQHNAALVQRLMLDLKVAKDMQKPLLLAFYRGFLGLAPEAELPRDTKLYTPALEALSTYADTDRQASVVFISQPQDLGKHLRNAQQPVPMSAL